MVRKFQSGGLALALAGEDDEEENPLMALLNSNQPASEEGLVRARQILDDLMADDAFSDEDDIIEKFKESAEDSRRALREAREKLVADRYNPAQAWLAAAQAFGSPTQTGAFGETIGNVAGAIREPLAQQDQFRRDRDKQILGIDTALAQSEEGALAAELKLAQLRRQQMTGLGKEALKVIARGQGATGSAGSKTREAKIQDLIGRRLPDGTIVDRALAVDIVDQHRELQMTDDGLVRGLDNVTGEAWEVPLGDATSRRGISSSFGDIGSFLEDEGQQLALQALDNQTASLWNFTEAGTGPGSAILAAASVPSDWLGGPVAQQTIGARQSLRIRSRDLARALIDNPRMPVRLIEMALEDASMTPAFWDSSGAAQARLAALDRELYDRYLDAREDAKNTGIAQRDREAQANNARAIGSFLRDLGVPESRQLRRRTGPKPEITPGIQQANPPGLTPAPPDIPPELWEYMTDEERSIIDPSYEPDPTNSLPSMWD